MATALLSVNGLSRRFGGLKIIDDISFDLLEGEVLGVIGPNGAGKTTLMSLLSGSLEPNHGNIYFDGDDVTRKSTHERARMGIGRTYQIPRPFGHMTVEQNLLVSAYFSAGAKERYARSLVADALALCGLQVVRHELAGRLPLLLRKRHELARALAGAPRVLLIDEVAGGLTDKEVDDFIVLVQAIKARGITVIWIEHILRAMMTATDRLLAISGGLIIGLGSPHDVLQSAAVRQVYLGQEAADAPAAADR